MTAYDHDPFGYADLGDYYGPDYDERDDYPDPADLYEED